MRGTGTSHSRSFSSSTRFSKQRWKSAASSKPNRSSASRFTVGTAVAAVTRSTATRSSMPTKTWSTRRSDGDGPERSCTAPLA